MSPLPYLLEYFETNSFTLYFVLMLLVFSLLKYVVRPELILSGRKALFFILAVGLVLRVGWLELSSYSPRSAWHSKHLLESDVTHIHAIELTKGIWFHGPDGKPSGRRPIGYPMVLGLLYKIFGVNITIAWIFHLTLYSFSAWLIFLMTKLIFSEKEGLIATLFYAVYPVSIYSIKLITDEHLFLPVWFLGLYLLLREIKGSRLPAAAVIYGLLFGYATMIRTHAIFMPCVVAFAYILMKRPWRKVLVSFVLVAAVMQLINVPWVIRNTRAWGVPVLYTATANFMYAQVNSTAKPEGGGHIPGLGDPDYSEELERAKQSGNAGLYHSVASREMARWIFNHPVRFLGIGFCRVLVFMGWDRAGGVWPLWFQFYEGSFDPSRPIPQILKDGLEETAYVFYYVLLFSFLFGLMVLFVKRRGMEGLSKQALAVLGACFLFWLLEHMVIYPDRKYRFPLELLMMIIASPFLAYIIFVFRWPGLFGKRKTTIREP